MAADRPAPGAPDPIADRADPASAGAPSTPSTQPAPPRRRFRAARAAALSLLALMALLLLAVGGAWHWAGTEGSHATALRWAGAHAPLTADGVRGSLRAGGSVQRLQWREGGLRIEVDDAELRWRPAALLRRTLHIERLAARRIAIDDQSPAAPTSGPPASLALPLQLHIDALQLGELAWAGPPAHHLHDVAGRYAYDGARHQLHLDQAQFEDGRYQGRASLGAHAPFALDAALTGALAPSVPDGGTPPLPLTVAATLRGPLADLQAQADVQADLQTVVDADPAQAPQAHLTARITAWAAQPLPEAQGRVHAIDLQALWRQAPRTQLRGQFQLAPLPAPAVGWALSANLANPAAGPWDRRQLPVDALQADLTWQDGTATVRTLEARAGGGQVRASGRWQRTTSEPTDAPWSIEAHISHVNPARLHTQLAAAPIDGTARAHGVGAAIDFDTALQARAAPAPAKTGDTRPLLLQSARARGRWADPVLTLEQLRVNTADAQLAGSAQLHWAGGQPLGGRADLRLQAPGLSATAQGELQAARGAGTLNVNLADAARALAWLRQLPGASAPLAGVQAGGSATLDGRWRGGWRDPEVHARLNAPRLSVSAGSQPAVVAHPLALTLDGSLAQAQLALAAQLTQGPRTLDLQAAASGGRSTPTAPLAASSWHAAISQLQARVHDPALGPGAWRIASRSAIALRWAPSQGGQFEASAGTLSVNSPAPSAQALIDRGPLRWRAGELSSTGRITGLPLQWAQRLAGAPATPDASLSGNVLLDGHWDAALGRSLRVQAELARASGDLSLNATDPDTGVQTRVAAGLRQARLQLTSDGRALNLQAQWDSQHAGQVDARLRTELSAATDPAGRTHWSWPASAPLQGQVQARLPQIAAWSALAPPGWRLRGALALDARVAGARGAPQLSGTAAADAVALRSVVDGIQFEGGRLRARFQDTRLVIDEFTLRGPASKDGSGGSLTARGEAGWADGQARAQLSATLDHLRASIRADRQVTVSGAVQAALAGRAIRADGRLRIDQARITLPDESRPELGEDVIVRGAGGKLLYGAPPPSAQPSAAPSPLTANVDVQVDLGEDFRVQGLGVDTRLAGTLQLAANGPLGAAPQLTGLVQTQGGRFQADSQNLDISRGRIRFTGALDNPTLDIIALRPNFSSDQKAGVQVAGTALLPRVSLYADPQLPDNQTLAWLLLGHAAPSTGAEAALLQSAALALLGGRNGRGLAVRFGLDELSFANSSDTSNGAVAGASVTLGKRLSDRLYAAYQHSLGGASGALLIFYELSRRWSLRGQAGENAAVDLIYRLSFD